MNHQVNPLPVLQPHGGTSGRTWTVICALWLLAAAAPAHAARMVFVAEQEVAFRNELYIVDTDRPGETIRLNAPMSAGANGVSHFAVSPDGAQIAFSADQEVAGDPDLFLIDITALGTWTRLGSLPADRREMFAKFSPDGGKIAFTASDETFGNVHLYLVDLAKPTEAVQLNGELFDSVSMTGFAFTPDGSRVVYVASELDRLFELYVVDLEEPGRSTRLNGPGGSIGDHYEGRFSILPDSTGVVYSAVGERPGVRELHIVDFAAPQPVRLNAPLQADGDIYDFKVSPDGRRVAYVADQEVDKKPEVFLVDLDAPGIATRLSGSVQAGAALPAFTPDGRYVLYLGDEERGPGERDLYRVKVDQPSDVVRVNNPPPAGTDLSRFAISSDGKKVAYVPGPSNGFEQELIVVDLEAPGSDLRVNGPLPNGLLDYTTPLFGPDDDSIAFHAAETLDGPTELFFASVSAPGTSLRLNAALPPDGYVATHPNSHAWLPAGAPPTGTPAPGSTRGDSKGGGGPVGPLVLLLVAIARLSRLLWRRRATRCGN